MGQVADDRDNPAALRELHELTILLLATLIPLDTGFVGALEHWFHSVSCLAGKPGDYQASRRQRQPRRPFVARALDLLADPATGARLALEGKRLACHEYGVSYDIRAGVPIFTEPRQIRGRRNPLTASREQLDALVRQRIPGAQRQRLPPWLRKVGSRALGR